MDPPAWTCPHCQGHDFVPSDGNERVGSCAACSFVYPRDVVDDDGSTWREQAELFDRADLYPQVRSDRYRIIRPLAAGAQGRILLAHHRHLDQICVIKILDLEAEWRDLATARLQAEARAGVLVSHRNVARVLDCDCVDNVWYFAMEYVAGENLRNVLKAAGRLPWPQVVEVGAQVADGLAAIHAASLVHRDLKPSNVMLRCDGVPKIMDLGLVKRRGQAVDLTLTLDGQILGTPFYMPPEQFDSDATVGPQTDLYAVGATLFDLLAGRPPFRGGSLLDLAAMHKHDPVVWPGEAGEAVPAWLRHVVETCLAKRPEHRFGSAEALAEALRTGAAGGAGAPLPAGKGGRARGVVVTAFKNLSRHPEDEWIGEALAEYLGNRLLEIDGLHVADRHSLGRLMKREDGGEDDAAEEVRLVEAAQKLGAGLVIVGGFQRSGEQLRVTAQSVRPEQDRRLQAIANVSGPIGDLFALEDQLADHVLRVVGQELARPRRSRGGSAGTENLEAHERFIRGRRAFGDGDYHAAAALGEEALALDPAYVDAVSLIGACCARIGDYDRALDYHQREEAAARREGDERRLAEALGNLGTMYYYKGEYSPAYEFLDQARRLAAEHGFESDAAKYDGNLGFVLMRLNRADEAEAAFARAIDVHKKHGDLVSLAWPYNGMGGVLLKQKRYAEAAEYYRRALAMAEEIGDRVNIGIGQMNLGRCACLLDDFAEAEACFDEALESLEGTDFWNGLTLVHGYMADMYLQERNTARALECIDRRLELAQKHGNHRLEAEAWEQRAKAYQLAGNTEEAIACLKRSIEVSQHPAPHESLHRYLSVVTKRAPFG